MENTAEKYDKIGGWLWLPAIGLALTPFLMAYTLSGLFANYTGFFVVPGDNAFNLFMLFELVGNLLYFTFTIILLVLFFKRKENVPRLMLIWYVFYFVFSGLDTFIGTWFYEKYSLEIEEDFYREFIKATVWLLVWGTYFMKSERVKGTFRG